MTSNKRVAYNYEDQLNLYERLVEQSQRQIDRAWKAYTILGALIAVLFGVGAIILNKSVSDIRQDIQDQASRMLEITQKQVSDRVDIALQEEGVRKIVKDKAAERIDAVADLLISNRVNKSVTPLVADIQGRVDSLGQDLLSAKQDLEMLNVKSMEKIITLDNTLEQAEAALNELRQVSSFSMTVLSAMNDDRKALDELRGFSNDSSYILSKEAWAAWIRIYTDTIQSLIWSPAAIEWNEGVKPETMDLMSLRKQYSVMPSQWKVSMLNYIWGREDIPKQDKLQFLIDVMQNDESLRAVLFAAKCFAEATGTRHGSIQFIDPLLSWWDENKDTIN